METQLEQRIQALDDREAIKEAVALYSLHILQAQTSKIPELFADDGVFRIESANLRIAGREALVAFFNRMTPGTTFPFVQTTAIVLEGDTARHVGVMDNPAYTGDRKGYQGIYHDALRRVGGRWLFTDRNFIFTQGGPPVPIPKT
jgi:hypothetical protein